MDLRLLLLSSVVLMSCGTSDHVADPDASAADSPAAATFQLEAPGCPGARSGLAALSLRKVLVTTGCGFYSVDTVANKVVALKARGEDVDNDGNVVAVLADQLGLSRDGGETFEWTDWALARCQGTPQVRAGAGFALVGCVAGVGRWSGNGAGFATVPVSGGLLIGARTAVGGKRVVLSTFDGWLDSSDSGESFQTLTVAGLPAGAQPERMAVGSTKVWVSVSTDDGMGASRSALFAAPVGSAAFARVAAFPETGVISELRYNDGVLVATQGSVVYLSADEGASFVDTKLQPIAETFEQTTSYLAGHVYRVAKGTLYVDAVQL